MCWKCVIYVFYITFGESDSVHVNISVNENISLIWEAAVGKWIA